MDVDAGVFVKDTIDGVPITLKPSSKDAKGQQHFCMFLWNNETYEIGDAVIISGATGFHVARIEDVRDSLMPEKDERYRVKVMWYEKWKDFKKSTQKQLSKSLAPEFLPMYEEEVVVDGRGYNEEIAVTSILKRCKILELSPDANVDAALDDSNDEADPVFVARFACDRSGKELKPLRQVDPGKSQENASVGCLPPWIEDLQFFKTSLCPFVSKNFRNSCAKTKDLFDVQRRTASRAKKAVLSRDSCTFAGQTYRIGDLVFLSNGDREVEEDELDNVYCARIDEMDEKCSMLSVTYFLRRTDLAETFENGKIPVDPPFLDVYEVALDLGSSGEMVPAASLVGKFGLAKASRSQDPRLVLSEVDQEKYPVLVTRFVHLKGRLIPFPRETKKSCQGQVKRGSVEKAKTARASGEKPEKLSPSSRPPSRSGSVEPVVLKKVPTVACKQLSAKELGSLMSSEGSDDEGHGWVIETVPEEDEAEFETFFPARASSSAPLSPLNRKRSHPVAPPRTSRRGSRQNSVGNSSASKNMPKASGGDKENVAGERPERSSRKGKSGRVAVVSEVSPEKKPRRENAVLPMTPASAVKRTVDLDDDDFVRTPTIDAFATKEVPVSSLKLKLKVKELFGNIRLPQRESPVLKPETPLLMARSMLHASAVPHSLPCREEEFAQIYAFSETHIRNGTGGCMYISGVPGTGKTATVQEVAKNLQLAKLAGELPDFKYIELNGMRLANPERIYTELWCGITDGKERLAPANASEKLKSFVAAVDVNGKRVKQVSRKRKPRGRPPKSTSMPGGTSYLVLVDELDLLWTRKQKVLYNLFDWPNQPGSRLVVLAVANTMDLPERILMNRVKSRLGMTRLVFHAYEFPQLQTIIQSRLEDLDCFDADAIQLVARKVASISGDARRALNICQKAAEAAEREMLEEQSAEAIAAGTPKKARGNRRSSIKPLTGKVTMAIVNQVIQETFSEPAVLAVKACSLAEQHFLRALVSDFERTGIQEAKFLDVYQAFKTLCVFDDLRCSGPREVLRICENLAASGIVINEGASSMGIHQRVMLNIPQDAIHYALNEYRDDE